jgi:hypothetical protein
MRILALITSLLLLAVFLLPKTISYWPETDFRAKAYLWLNSDDFEHLISLVEKQGYSSVQWVTNNNISAIPVRHAWTQGLQKYIKVEKPELGEVIEFSEQKGITSLWLQKFEGNWLVRKAFNYQNGDIITQGYFLFGNPENIESCNKDDCYYQVSKYWYIIKN